MHARQAIVLCLAAAFGSICTHILLRGSAGANDSASQARLCVTAGVRANSASALRAHKAADTLDNLATEANVSNGSGMHAPVAASAAAAPTATASAPRKCVATQLRKDRHGSAVHDMLFAWAHAEANQLKYVGAVGAKQGLPPLMDLLRLPWSLHSKLPGGCQFLPVGYRNERVLASAPLDRLKTPLADVRAQKDVIAVHVRRGDVKPDMSEVGDSFRYLPNGYYLNAIREARERYPSAEVHVFSEKSSTEPMSDFSAIGAVLRLGTPMQEVWRTMIQAQEVILSRSSFSYVPALFATGRVTYVRFWHPPHHSWYVQPTTIAAGLPRPPATVADMATPDMEEKYLPCRQHPTVESHVCVLDGETTVVAQHFPHFAQTALPCWHWFLAKRATNCVVHATAKGSKSAWNTDFVRAMGCTLREAPVKTCAVTGHWRRRLRVEPGESYDWAITQRDASVLQDVILSRLDAASRAHNASAGLHIGALQRRKSRPLHVTQGQDNVDVRSALLTAAQSTTKGPIEVVETAFEKLGFLQQFRWMQQQDIIITPHGAAVTNAVFVRKCTVIVQVYPAHYYPIAFFEPLIRAAGGIPITWYPGVDLKASGAQLEKQTKAAIEDFKQHHGDRGNLRDAPARIPQSELAGILELAVQLRSKCLK